VHVHILRSRLWLSYAALIATALGVMAVAFGFYLWRNPLLYRQTLARLRTVETGILNRQGDFVRAFAVSGDGPCGERIRSAHLAFR